MLDAQLGTKWRDRFSSFDDKPVASASIGQVHKGIWSDGREVAVKIQYPGADEALRADLKTIQRLVGVFKQLAPGADIQGVVDELTERTEMELDYRLEADNQRAFAKAYRNDPHFAVPAIIASAPKVVISEWMEGIPMSVIIREGTPEQRDLMGTRLTELTFGAPARLEMMHGDAHPGNFMLLPDGRMGVIDFGAVAPLPGGFPTSLGETIRLARDKNYDELLPTMERAGFLQKGQEVSIEEVEDMLRQYVDPIKVDVFHYNRKWLQKMAASQMDNSVAQIKMARSLDLPANLAIPLRVIASTVAICCQLDAHVPVKSLPPNWFRDSPRKPRSAIRRSRPEPLGGKHRHGTECATHSVPFPLTGRSIRRRPGCRRNPYADARADACARQCFRGRGSRHPRHPTVPAVRAPRSGTAHGSGTPRTGPWPAQGRRGSRRTTDPGHRHGTAPPAVASRMSSARRPWSEQSSQWTCVFPPASGRICR